MHREMRYQLCSPCMVIRTKGEVHQQGGDRPPLALTDGYILVQRSLVGGRQPVERGTWLPLINKISLK